MNLARMGALSGAFVMAAGLGAAVAPVAQGQSRDREPAIRALQLMGGDARIGIEVSDADAKDATGGVVVDDVQSDSPAEKAGMKRGDTIVEFDGERVRSVAQFQRLVQETPEGRTVKATVVRAGQRVPLSVTPERRRGSFMYDDTFPRIVRPTPAPAAPPAPPAPYLAPGLPGFDFSLRSNDRRLGIMTESLSDQLNEYFGVKSGVLVRSVTEDSPAAKAGVKAGDVIVSVNGHHVDEPSDISEELRRASSDDFTLEVVRERKTQTLKGKVEARLARPRWRTST